MSADGEKKSDGPGSGRPKPSSEGRSRQSERERRLAERLRDNLKRRKAQDRARRAGDPGAGGRDGEEET